MTDAERERAAQAATKAKKWSQAAALWEELYQQQQTLAINQQLVTALVQNQQYLAASNYAAEFENDYLQTDQRSDLYLTALLASHQFIVARMVVTARPRQPWQSLAEQRISQAERAAETTMASTLTTTMREFYHLSDQPVPNQAARIQAAQHLTYQRYLTAAQFLLVDPFLHQLARVEVLHTLRAIGVDQPVQFRHLDGQQTALIPSELAAVGTDPTSQRTHQALEKTLGQRDPTLYTGLNALLTLQLMYIYPDQPKIVADPTTWVQLFVAEQTGTPVSTVDQQAKAMLTVQRKIQDLNNQLQAQS
ncbi:hypothetical protein [Lactiplantibacillus plajomi]|uniref:TPR repeat-containing protein n=1 Tax=Lactiplantibacillus plajomi TaxID=1457217 RepID=A0ABV6K3G8_9LACO|nr:hypothetical protein [Lactiplantibacillus plajomi]